MRRHLWGPTVVAAFALVVFEGCNRCCRRSCLPACPGEAGPPATVLRPRLLPRHPLAPYQSTPVVPCPAPSAVVPAVPVPSPPAVIPAPPPPPVAPPSEAKSYRAPEILYPSTQPESTWQPPGRSGVRLEAPQSTSPDAPRDQVRLQAPEPATPRSEAKTEPPLAGPSKPAVTEERALTPSLPVGIPQFASVKERVTAGLKPALEGFDWLKSNGYKSVLHLHTAAATDSADRKVVEKQNLGYLGLEVAPESLAQSAGEFNRIVGDASLYPLFVYDKDGTLAGIFWYLHFRTIDKLPDEAARKKASPLGFKEKIAEEHTALWLAAQKYLAGQDEKK